MSQPNVYKTVTLTATGSAQNILTQLKAIDATIVGYARELNLQADPGNSTDNIWIGDDALANTRLGYALTAGSTRQYRDSTLAGVPLANMFFMGSGGSPKLNVEIVM